MQISEKDFQCLYDNVCDEVTQKPVTQKCKPYNISQLLESDCIYECVDNQTNYTQNKQYAEKINVV